MQISYDFDRNALFIHEFSKHAGQQRKLTDRLLSIGNGGLVIGTKGEQDEGVIGVRIPVLPIGLNRPSVVRRACN